MGEFCGVGGTVGEFCGVGGTPGAPLFPPGALGCRQGEGAAGPGLPGGGLRSGGGSCRRQGRQGGLSPACARRLHAGWAGGAALHPLRGRLHHMPGRAGRQRPLPLPLREAEDVGRRWHQDPLPRLRGPRGGAGEEGGIRVHPSIWEVFLQGGSSCFPPSLQHHGYMVPSVGRPQPWLRDPRCPPRGFGVPVVGLTPFSISPPPGAGPALLPQAHRLHPAHLPLGQSHPHGAAGIGVPGPHHKPARDSGGPPPCPSSPTSALPGPGLAALRATGDMAGRLCRGGGVSLSPAPCRWSRPPHPSTRRGRGTDTSFNPPRGLKPSLISPPVP